MYKIIGADQKEYGPISAEQMRQWIAEGRVNAQTQARAEGAAGWQPVSAFPEFATLFSSGTPTIFAAEVTSAEGRALALSQVSGPAIGLIVTAVVGMLFRLLSIAGARFAGMNNPPANAPPWMERFFQMRAQSNGLPNVVFGIIGLAMGVLILMGGLKMKKLEGYGFCMIASIVAMIPFFSPCCCLGLPLGIWALIILNRPEVKAQFN